jgi:hypothetical protein
MIAALSGVVAFFKKFMYSYVQLIGEGYSWAGLRALILHLGNEEKSL